MTHSSSTSEDPVVIVGSARTPIGGFQGVFSSLQAPELGAIAIRAALQRATLDPQEIDEVIMGCVLSAGQGQAPARQASLAAGIPESAGCTTINKMCGSGMKAVMLAHDLIMAGSANIVVAGGMESMTNAPYLLDKARSGYRMSHGTIKDHMFLDGLEDAYDKGTLMGVFAEITAEKYGFTRKAQDDYALASLSRAKQAIASKWFQSEVEVHPVRVKNAKLEVTILDDEQPGNAKPEKIPTLKTPFKENGTVTAANSSSISDGAAALVLMRLSQAKQRHLPILAKILKHSAYATSPNWFTVAPVGAMTSLLKQLHWTLKNVDLVEINEAFAVVPMVAMKDLQLSHEKLNVHGGACALGHPIGGSGARIISTLLGALQRLDLTTGIAAVCIGGGEATALAVERF